LTYLVGFVFSGFFFVFSAIFFSFYAFSFFFFCFLILELSLESKEIEFDEEESSD